MAQDLFQYDKMVENALRGVAREALARTARDGVRGDHHFYVTFRTGAPGVVLPPQIVAKFPEEMTIVLQHQFWGLEVGEATFSVTLSFSNRMERLTIPFAAITTFADPSVKFGLQFAAPTEAADGDIAAAVGDEPALPAVIADKPKAQPKAGAEKAPSAEKGQVVALDAFRKR